MKIGIDLKLDVSKLDKDRFFKGAKGTYCDLTAFIDTEVQGQYGDNGVINQKTSKEEWDSGVKLPIVGNVKVFYKSDTSASEHAQHPANRKPDYYTPQGGNEPDAGKLDGDIPF